MSLNPIKQSPEERIAKYGTYIKFMGVAFLLFSVFDLAKTLITNCFNGYLIFASDPAKLNADALEAYNALYACRVPFWIGTAFSLLYALLEVAAGICGLRFHSRPDKVNACIITGFLVLAALIGQEICVALCTYSYNINNLINQTIPLAILFFYIFGAFQVKKAYK